MQDFPSLVEDTANPELGCAELFQTVGAVYVDMGKAFMTVVARTASGFHVPGKGTWVCHESSML